MVEDSTDPLLGRLIDGRYLVQERLGAGAAGSVYRAREQAGRQREVAIKIWHHSMDDDTVLGRFKREAAALDTLIHPNVVDIYDCGFVDGLPYMAMELLSGCTLEELLPSSGTLHVALTLDIAHQLLDALACAHERGLVHRDIKPDNIFLVSERGAQRVKVLDYGLAKFISRADAPAGDMPLTAEGTVIGTPLYMPPEQAAGGNIDLRTDVYSAGCVLFEMLAGQPPYIAETLPEILRLHYKEPIPRLRDHRSDLDDCDGLQALLDRAMAKRPAERYANAGEMLEALDALATS